MGSEASAGSMGSAGSAGSMGSEGSAAVRHLLDVDDLTPMELRRVLALAEMTGHPRALDGEGVAIVFEKPSSRTRNSTEMAVVQLGGHPVYITGGEVGFDVRESAEDLARTLACYHAAIGARVLSHSVLERMAAVSPVPVVNLLSDYAHPLQALADVLTLKTELCGGGSVSGDGAVGAAGGGADADAGGSGSAPAPTGFGLDGRVLAFVGDSNNVARSLVLAAGAAGMSARVASPAGYGFDEGSLLRLRRYGCDVTALEDPVEAVRGAHAVYTDVWVSMGQEEERQQRIADFDGYTVDDALMAQAAPGAVFLHCLPACRGCEVTDGVLDGPASRVWPQAANRLHATRGLLLWMCEQTRGKSRRSA